MYPNQSKYFTQQDDFKFCFNKPYWKDNFISFTYKENESDADGKTYCGSSVEPSSKVHALKKTIALYNLINRRFSLCECDIQVLLNEVISDLHYLAHQRNIVIRVYSDISIRVFTSPELLRLIFHNLLENAIIYSKPDPHYAYVEVDCSLVNDQLKIIVEDNGVGIDASQLPFIFQPLQGEKSECNQKRQGLYLVKKALGFMHGTIQVESVAGCYTRMRVDLNFVD